MSAILLDGGIVHYEVIGRGRPVIFLHTWLGSWRYWVPSMQTTSTGYRAYALDLWGFGDSAREPTQYSLEAQVETVSQFMEELGMNKVALVGHGLGALVGLILSMHYPNVVDRIMAVGLPFNSTYINNRLRTGSLAELTDWLVTKNPSDEAARTDGPKADPLALATSFSSLDLSNFSIRLSNLNTPCLLVYGGNDPAITTPNYDKASTPINTHMIVLEQSAHFPMLDDPANFNRLLTDFLALQSGESPRDLQLKENWKRRVR